MKKRKMYNSTSSSSDKGKEEEREQFSYDEEEEEVERPRGLPSVSDAFKHHKVPEVSDTMFDSLPDAESCPWSCDDCREAFPKIQLLWAHLDTCAAKTPSSSDENYVKDILDGWDHDVDKLVVAPPGLFTPWKGLNRFKEESYVPQQGGSLMTEEEQMRWALEASVGDDAVHHGMTEEEQWRFQKEASMEYAGDALVRVLELDKEMDDMQVAMAASVMDLPDHEYYKGREAYMLSCEDLLISPFGVLMAPEVLNLLYERSYLNSRCPKCVMDNRKGPCDHFLPHDFAHLMRMRRVCKQWMVCIDNWMKRTRIKKSAANCIRCQLMHYNTPEFVLPHFVQASWCNLKIKLSNDYEVETEVFPCHYPLHNSDQQNWRKFYK